MYRDFARFYVEGGWSRYSACMARMLPGALETFGLWPRGILDLACGDGTFAVAMAARGLTVTGVDLSRRMLDVARERARAQGVRVDFRRQDMRSLNLPGRFDLVTCWFDSLNYLLEINHLAEAFAGVSRLLRDGGVFIFDMNTIRGLAVDWVRQPCFVHIDSGNSFLVSVPRYDAPTRTASLRLTGFSRQGARWVRMDETHQERGYTLGEIRRCLRLAHLREMGCWASLDRMDRPGRDAARVYFVAGKRPAAGRKGIAAPGAAARSRAAAA